MLANGLAIVNGSLMNLAEGHIDLANGVFFLHVPSLGGREKLQVGARIT
jgi:hypothetical protein